MDRWLLEFRAKHRSDNLDLAWSIIDWDYVHDKISDITNTCHSHHPNEITRLIFDEREIVGVSMSKERLSGVLAVIGRLPTGFILIYHHYESRLNWEENLGTTPGEILTDIEQTFERAIVAPTLNDLLIQYGRLPESRQAGLFEPICNPDAPLPSFQVPS
jgi:hypothetical protein